MADIILTFRQFIEQVGRDEAIKMLLKQGYDEAWAAMIIALSVGETEGDSKLTIKGAKS